MLISVFFVPAGCGGGSPVNQSTPAVTTPVPAPTTPPAPLPTTAPAPTTPPAPPPTTAPAPTTPPAPPPTTAPTPIPMPGPNNIWMPGDKYVPATLTVPVGTLVTWTNKDPDVHTVTSYAGLFDSGPLSWGQTFSYNFTQPGSFDYYCSTHLEMTGKIIVR